jgi:hypothetical protein
MPGHNPYHSLASDPHVAMEYKNKLNVLSQRLQVNGFDYKRDYNGMNDKQRHVFTLGLFVVPEQADNIDEYVEFGHNNCNCPDVSEDLQTMCPSLMAGVKHIQHSMRESQTKAIETTLELLIERCIDEIIQEGRGVMHPDTIGLKLANEKGLAIETVGQQFIKIGEPEAITNQEQLALAVYQLIAKQNKIPTPNNLKAALSNNKLSKLVLYSNAKGQEDKLPARIKSAQVLLAKADKGKTLGKEVYAFIKFGAGQTSPGPPWQQTQFRQQTGFGSKTTQAGKEIQEVGPSLLGGGRDQKMALNSVPGSLDESVLSKIDTALARSLPAYLKAAVAGQALPVLQFESEENRDQYLPSIFKYLSEVTGPIFLATGNKAYLGNDAVLDSALDNLLKPRGVNNWTETDGVSWPMSKNEKLKDSYVHFGDKQDIMVSSKAGKGANPSVAELYAELADIEQEEKQQLIELYGPGNPSGISLYTGNMEDPGIVDMMADKRYSWWDLVIRMHVVIAGDYNLTGDQYNQVRELMKAERANKWPREMAPVADKNIKAKLDKFKALFNPNTDKSDYSEALHIIAGMAKLAQQTVNNAQDKNGEKIFTNFAKAMYNRLPLVQIYAKRGAYVADGDTGIKSGPLDIIYPAKFDGEIRVDGGKNYFATGNKGKMTIAIK